MEYLNWLTLACLGVSLLIPIGGLLYMVYGSPGREINEDESVR